MKSKGCTVLTATIETYRVCATLNETGFVRSFDDLEAAADLATNLEESTGATEVRVYQMFYTANREFDGMFSFILDGAHQSYPVDVKRSDLSACQLPKHVLVDPEVTL